MLSVAAAFSSRGDVWCVYIPARAPCASNASTGAQAGPAAILKCPFQNGHRKWAGDETTLLPTTNKCCIKIYWYPRWSCLCSSIGSIQLMTFMRGCSSQVLPIMCHLWIELILLVAQHLPVTSSPCSVNLVIVLISTSPALYVCLHTCVHFGVCMHMLVFCVCAWYFCTSMFSFMYLQSVVVVLECLLQWGLQCLGLCPSGEDCGKTS